MLLAGRHRQERQWFHGPLLRPQATRRQAGEELDQDSAGHKVAEVTRLRS
jgi:hypothetical protein